MARQNSDDFGISDDEIQEIARQLEMQAISVKASVIETVNDAADDVVSRGIKKITQSVNLTPAYIQRHLAVSKRANKNSDEAIISATKRPVLLSRYDAMMAFRPSRDKRGRSSAMVQGGVSVRVKTSGSRITMPSAFLIKLRGSGVMGVAVRPNSMKNLNKREWGEVNKRGYAVLSGPSVDQLFSATKDELAPSIDELMDSFIRKLNSV